MIEYKELSVRYKHFYIEERMESCPFCTRPHIKFGVLNSKREFVESKSAEPTTNDTPYICPVCEHPFYYHQSKVDDSHVVYMYLQIASDISWNYYCMAIDTKSNKAVSSILLNRKHYDKPCPDDLVKYVMSHRDELLSYTNTDSEQRLWDDVIYGFRFYYGNMHNRIYVNTRYLVNHPILKYIVDRLEFLPAFNTIYI